MKKTFLVAAVVLTTVAFAAAQRVNLKFDSESEQFKESAMEYTTIWKAEGDKIIAAMEKVSGIRFEETDIRAIVYEGVSWSGRRGSSPMKMRASYPRDTKKATLVHELGHRHIAELYIENPEIDEHRALFLFLYDVWTELYGKDFADAQVAVEKRRRGVYPEAWDWALAMTRAGRDKTFRGIVVTTVKKKPGSVQLLDVN